MRPTKDSDDYKTQLAAQMSVFKRIRARIGGSIKPFELEKIEKQLDLTEDMGKTFSRYERGARLFPRQRSSEQGLCFAEFVQNAYAAGFLTDDELCELGLEVAKTKHGLRSLIKDRESALRLFIDGRENMAAGFLPQRVHDGADGWQKRAPRSEAEMTAEYEKWKRAIGVFGGTITYESYYVRKPTAADLAEVQVEEEEEDAAYRCQVDLERQFLAEGGDDPVIFASWEAEDEEVACYPAQPPLPAYHPSKVRNLNLWFGGREYSSRPYRLLEEHETSDYLWKRKGSDDFVYFFAMSKAQRQRAGERIKEAEKIQRRKQKNTEARQEKSPSTSSDKARSRLSVHKDAVTVVAASASSKIQTGTLSH